MKPRYETCKICNREWNVSAKAKVPVGGYLCPACAARIYEQAKGYGMRGAKALAKGAKGGTA